MKILMKWGEFSCDVQFILQRSEQQKTDTKQAPHNENIEDVSAATSTAISIEPLITERNKENRKSFGSHDSNKPPENVGIVKGIQQIFPTLHRYQSHTSPDKSITFNENPNNTIDNTTAITAKPNVEFNSASVRNSLDRKTNLFRDASSNESLMDYGMRSSHETYKGNPLISSNGALVPPPYRDPPPPRVSPLHQKSDSLSKMFEYKVSPLPSSSYSNTQKM